LYDTEINDQQFIGLAKVVYNVAGINLTSNKKNLLKARIAKRLRATRIDTVKDYIEFIKTDGEEFNNFIDGITTNHTYFFRENKHCEYLVHNLDKSKYYRIWSAASSSGEESYSIAMQLFESGFQFEIFASDISDTMLKNANAAVYHISRTNSVPEYMLKKYFLKGRNTQENMVKVRDEVKRFVSFGKYNLVTGTPSKQYDIIFCRNVMIYFDNPTKQKVVNDIYKSLVPGGIFIFGQSESVVGIKTKFRTLAPSIYQKI
jgi:chemotaxis protein methyltransferase CheR